MKQARMLRDYRTQYHDPITFRAGDKILLGKRDTEWPDFIWATGPNGRSGWAPLSMIDASGEAPVATVDYSARELDANAVEVVQLAREVGGWWWAQNARGAFGWLPARDMENLEETT